MPEQFTQSAPSPPKGVSASSSIFAYQTRILQRTSSTTNGSRPSSHSHSFSNGGITSLAALANASPPSTPIRQNVAKMAAMGNQTMARSDSGRAIGLGPGMKGRSAGAHGKGSKSVELVRGQWESKISDVSTIDTTPVMPRKRTSVFSPPLQPSSTMSASPKSPPVRTPSSGVFASAMSPERTGFPGMTSASMESEASNGGGYRSSYMAARAAKRAGAPGTNGYDPVNISDSTSIGSVSSTTSTNENDTIRQRATSTSITSYTSILSPSLTGSSGISGIASERTQAVEDTLAVARANALKRLEARKKAKAGASDQNDATKRVVVTETPTKGLNLEPKKSSPFGDLFVPSTSADLTPTRNPKQSSPTKTPTSSNTRSPYRPIVTPPSAPSWASSRHAPSGLSSNTPQSSSSGSSSTALGSGGPGGKDKYGSLSRTDKRRLGRHLPRIASGDGGWDDEVQNGHMRGPSASDRRPSALGRSSVDTSATRDSPPSVNANTAAPSVSMTPSSRPKPEVLAPCTSENRPSHPASVPSTPGSKPKSAYLPQTPKSKSSAASGFGLVSPRPEVAGEEMKGLMNAVGSMPVRGGTSKDDGEGLTGQSGSQILRDVC